MCSSAQVGPGHEWFAAPPGYALDQPNPFSPDGLYGPQWSCFELAAAEDDRIISGRHPNGQFHVRMGRRAENLVVRLGDFLRYETAQGRKIIVACPPDVRPDEQVAAALEACGDSSAPRPDDPRWLVHATTLAAWEGIRASGALLSSAALQRAGVQIQPVGEALVGDPPDFAEHVALGTLEAIGPEFVVACRQAGRMLPEPDVAYEPGVRLYFDAHHIIADGLAVRDGLHTLKVRTRLALRPYLAANICAADLPPLASGKQWTTSLFRDQANALFQRRHGGE
jgi:hypothetical protein